MNNIKPERLESFSKKNLDKKYLDKIKDISFTPVFILGFHRSGTSILYKMTSSTDEFNSVTTYHVIQYNRLLYNKIENKEQEIKDKLNDIFSKKDRGIDRLNVDTELPLEYAFLINNTYLFSKLSKINMDKFQEMCKKIQYVEGALGQN